MEPVRLGCLLLRNGGLREDLLDALHSERTRLSRARWRRAAIASVMLVVLAAVAVLRVSAKATAPRAVEPVLGPESTRDSALPEVDGGRAFGPAVALSDGGASGGLSTRGTWMPDAEGLRGTADPHGGRTGAQAAVPEEYRLRTRYRCDEGCEADLLVSTGRADSSARFTLPTQPAGAWRSVEVVAVGDQVRVVLDGVPLPPLDASRAPDNPRRFVGVAVERGSLTIGETTLESMLPESRIR